MDRVAASLIAAVLLFPTPCAPQESGASTGLPYELWGMAGPTTLIGDFGEEGSFSGAGVFVVGGVAFSSFEIGLSHSRWPDANNFRYVANQLELIYPFFDGLPISPHILLGVGQSTIEFLGDETRASEGRRASASYGVGARAALSRLLAIRADIALRTDGGAWNGAWRLAAGFAPRVPVVERAGGASTEFGIAWMAPVGGPWRFVEPAYEVRISRPLSPTLSASLGVSVVHWQIPDEGFIGGFIWDTRAFVGTPSIEWNAQERLPIVLRGGPTFAAMGEGPDGGVTVGAHMGADLRLRSFTPLPLTVGVGWLWLKRTDDSLPRIGGADQHGLMLRGALAW